MNFLTNSEIWKFFFKYLKSSYQQKEDTSNGGFNFENTSFISQIGSHSEFKEFLNAMLHLSAKNILGRSSKTDNFEKLQQFKNMLSNCLSDDPGNNLNTCNGTNMTERFSKFSRDQQPIFVRNLQVLEVLATSQNDSQISELS